MRLNFKLVCIFIIAIYCLSPLAAADFNQTSDVKLIDHEDEDAIAVDDEKVATDDDQIEDIEAADGGSSEVKCFVDDSDAVAEENDKDTRLNPNIRVECADDDPVKGEVTFVVSADYKMDGQYILSIDGYEITKYMYNGNSKVTVGGVSAGEHTVEVTYLGSHDFTPSSATITINVNDLADPNLNINLAGDVYEGDDVAFDISAKEKFSGKVSIKLDSGNVYDVDVVNGKATANIGSLDAGKHTATLSFAGDKHFKAAKKTINFEVYGKGKSNPKLSLDINDAVEGQGIPAIISSDKEFEGDVTLKVLDTDKVYNLHVKDGEVTQDITGLTAGTYTAVVSFEGNENYTPSQSTATFEVQSGLIDPKLSVRVADVMEGGSAVVKVTADEAFSGNVKVTVINLGTEYTAKVVDGTGSVAIDGLAPGKYAVKVSFDGDDTFKASENTAIFSVKYKKLDTNLTIKCTDDNPVEGKLVHLLVTSDYKVSGNLYFTVDDYSFEGYMFNGRWNVPIEGLTAGEHTVTVQYYGSDQFTPSTATLTFTVNEK